jgi:capsular polysaccharide transport system permease protein
MEALEGREVARPRGWLGEALRTQARVIGALVLRETRTRFGRSQMGYLWALAEPLGYILFLSLVFSAVSRQAPFGPSMAMFFASGILPFQLFHGVSRMVSNAFEANEALLHFPVVKPVDTLLARAALESATSLTVMLLVLPGIVGILGLSGPNDLAPMAAAFAGLVLAGFGIGTINAVAGQLYPSWRNVYDVVSRPLMIISGVFFLPDSLPPAARDLIAYLPTTQGIELFRHGFYEGYRSNILDPAYFFALGLGLTLIGLSAERAVRMRGE